MTRWQRRSHRSVFKSKTALVVLQRNKTIAELAKQFEAHGSSKSTHHYRSIPIKLLR